MPFLKGLRQTARPSGAVVLAALGQLAGGIAVLGWAYTRADWLGGGGPIVLTTLVGLGLLGCGLALLPTHVLSLLCGWAFGVPGGFMVAILTVTAASPIGYAAGRALAGAGAGRFMERHPRGAVVCEAITRASPVRAGLLTGLLRLSPVVPYGSTNVLAAIFRVPMLAFMIGTLIGLAPRVLLVVVLGAGLERLESGQAASPWLVGLGLAGTIGALVLISLVTRQTLSRIAKTSASTPA
ncbi:MAG: VTT domain-containing protein [Planctomycetota bacterium]